MTAGCFELRLPTPPSANRYWRTVVLPRRGAVVLKSSEARKYAETVAVLFRGQHGRAAPLEGPIRLSLVWRRERRAGDLSNRIKVVEDSLQGLAYLSDAQVVELHAYRVDGEEPGVSVTVEALAAVRPPAVAAAPPAARVPLAGT